MIDALAKGTVWISLSLIKDLPDDFKQELLYGTGERHLKYTYTSRNTGSTQNRSHPFEGVIK